MKKLMLFILIFLSIVNTCFSEELSIGDGDKILKVGIIQRDPFVVKNTEGVTGFSVELWEIISNKLGLKYDFIIYDEFGKMLKSAQYSNVDLAIGNISITSGRQKSLDFSYPIFHGGIGMMEKIPKELKIIDFAKNNDYIYFFYVLLFILIFTYIIHRIVERGRVNDMYYYVSFYSFMLVFVSLFFYNFTLEKISQFENHIFTIEKLKYKKIGVIKDSTSNQLLVNNGIGSIPYKSLNNLYDALKKNEIELIIYDKAILDFYSKNNIGFHTVGGRLKLENFGIAFPKGSKIREDINIELLKLINDGEYIKLHNKYFY